ncbi:hypothetical protein [Halobacterium salinarum]|uniref:Uncharacterized protein n=1 Tax=Halobacterium salinarum (strain ATCC 33171 / DSM 3754 / JCM 8978 / NBRC 102687 / NCIMB 764 / 91-R6) TaxID=2597657 RepID=A0A4D6GSK2_HALS9|nr:hypothetical protein [Halobacterium salinarum]MDL0124296.1 hypothetical protein [Halobacterium salinarum]MDL0135956.1 hypothetical protein [Halobacterium salinarum]MDL0144309.1 hypothetical protein [Halobacterium salinarum]QCC44501.1 uncharacterized protein HBSAL_03885 [Halobacterium salinarum]TYO76451.1 hypothetical protein APQ99_01088 [Halobacterium salinarum DSM 3754]
MGVVAALPYGLLTGGLLAASWGLLRAGSMTVVPLYDADAASDPAALSTVVAVSLAAFAVATLAFTVLRAVGRDSVVVVAGYGVAVLSVALTTAWRARAYE